MNIDGYEIPTLRGIAPEPTLLGIPKRHAGLLIAFGVCPLIILAWANDAPLASVGLGLLVIPLVLAVLRWAYKRDPHWMEHLTWHRFPKDVWQGE